MCRGESVYTPHSLYAPLLFGDGISHLFDTRAPFVGRCEFHCRWYHSIPI